MVNNLPPLAGPVDASGEPQIEHFWTAVERGWDIEPRTYFEEKAVAMGFKSPVEMAVHWMWKRHAKDWPAAAALPSPPAQEHWHRFKYQIALRAMVCRCGFRINED